MPSPHPPGVIVVELSVVSVIDMDVEVSVVSVVAVIVAVPGSVVDSVVSVAVVGSVVGASVVLSLAEAVPVPVADSLAVPEVDVSVTAVVGSPVVVSLGLLSGPFPVASPVSVAVPPSSPQPAITTPTTASAPQPIHRRRIFMGQCYARSLPRSDGPRIGSTPESTHRPGGRPPRRVDCARTGPICDAVATIRE
jgi:hypothetical protein